MTSTPSVTPTRDVFTSRAPRSVVLIRLVVGTVFLSEGIQKFLFPDALGVGRFVKIGISAPAVMAPFVAGVEIVGGTMILLGFATRLATIPLMIGMIVAIASTKLPMVRTQGFWAMAHEARVDWSMILGAEPPVNGFRPPMLSDELPSAD